MESVRRREKIIKLLRAQSAPVSATAIAGEMGVSRQVIVGDIALLRAQGFGIVSTARGYTMQHHSLSGRFLGKLACAHCQEQTWEELMTIVDNGGEILDVIVEHDLYGELAGQLNISTSQDVEQFVGKVRDSDTRLLSELTGGLHLHTVACRDANAFDRIRKALDDKHMLFHNR